MFGTLISLARTANTIGTCYLVGQVGLKVYRSLQKMQRERLHADEVKTKFIIEYTKEHGVAPPEKLVETVLRSHSAVEHPVQKRMKDACEKAKKHLKQYVGKDKSV